MTKRKPIVKKLFFLVPLLYIIAIILATVALITRGHQVVFQTTAAVAVVAGIFLHSVVTRSDESDED